MSNDEWIVQQIDALILSSKNYIEIATLESAKELILEQSKRIEQHTAELDGSLWSPKEW
ncbi:hypothetical protein ACWOAH_07925 [Vagococcus vulneris]|uniref:hypothetical protein n=1 Tax=Vagococcus vulneris TaxID=1977869 RepID=UPI0014040022|nr:hypothetical protein [Vagococcus vulneris]